MSRRSTRYEYRVIKTGAHAPVFVVNDLELAKLQVDKIEERGDAACVIDTEGNVVYPL